MESFGQVGADLGGLAKLGTDLAVLLRILLGPTFRTGTPALPRYAPRSVPIAVACPPLDNFLDIFGTWHGGDVLGRFRNFRTFSAVFEHVSAIYWSCNLFRWSITGGGLK